MYMSHIHPSLTIPTWLHAIDRQTERSLPNSAPWMHIYPSPDVFPLFTLISIHSSVSPHQGTPHSCKDLVWTGTAHTGSPPQHLCPSRHYARIICLLVNSPAGFWAL